MRNEKAKSILGLLGALGGLSAVFGLPSMERGEGGTRRRGHRERCEVKLARKHKKKRASMAKASRKRNR